MRKREFERRVKKSWWLNKLSDLSLAIGIFLTVVWIWIGDIRFGYTAFLCLPILWVLFYTAACGAMTDEEDNI